MSAKKKNPVQTKLKNGNLEFTYLNPHKAQALIAKNISPLPAVLEESFDENDELISEEALQEGVSLDSLLKDIELEACSDRNDKLANLARDLLSIEGLFNSKFNSENK